MRKAKKPFQPGKILVVVFVVAMLLLFMFPIFWSFLMSFKPREDIFTLTPSFFPSVWSLEEYQKVLSMGGAARFFFNSTLVALGATALGVFLSTTCGYGLQRMSGKSSQHLSNAVLMLRMVPTMVCQVPFYLLFRQLKLINSLPALAVIYAALSLPLAIWLSLGFYRNIPDSVYEAAMVDGCTEWQLFARIAFPLAKGSIVVVVLNVFFFAWNEFSLAMVLINKEQYRTMAVGIRYFVTNTLETPYARMAAAGMVCVVPTVIITVLMQNYLIQGFVQGAVKG